MEEIVKLIPLLLIALLADSSIILFILMPPVLFGGTFALIEWGSEGFNPLVLIDMIQIGMYTGTTALISQFVPLFLTAVTLVWLRHMYRPSAWQLGALGVIGGVVYGGIHYYLTGRHDGDVMSMVAVMSGVGAYVVDRLQLRRGSAPAPVAQLFLAPETPGNLREVSIQTDRLDLSCIDLSLADIIFETFTPEVTRFLSTRAPMIPAESEQFLRETLMRIDHGEEIVLAIREAYTGRFLGLCGIHARGNARQPELGIWLREDAQGLGYGEEVIHALIIWGSRHLVCEGFAYRVSPHNHASIRLAEKVGGKVIGRNESDADTITTLTYHIPRYTPHPAQQAALLRLWLEGDDQEESLRHERYRLVRERDVVVDSDTPRRLQAYTIRGRYLVIHGQRIEADPRAWIAAGEQIDRLISDTNVGMPYFNKEAAMALALYLIHTDTHPLLSIELISALTLDPPEPTVTNRHDPIAPITTVAAVPNNYYVLIFAINGRYKYIFHFHSDGSLAFETVHTMGEKMLPAVPGNTQRHSRILANASLETAKPKSEMTQEALSR